MDKDSSKASPAIQKPEKVYETFFGTRAINGHSIETPAKQSLSVILAHRFGRINQGFFDMFGLDQASMRFGFEYGILDNLCVGFGRSTYLKTWDGFVKYRVLEQTDMIKTHGSNGKNRVRGIPLSIALFASIAIDGRKKLYADNRPEYFSSRLSYTYQIMIARKFNKWFSLQLTPTLNHMNMVKTKADPNLLFIMGAAARFRITRSFAIMAEYYYRVNDNKANGYQDAMAIGFDINTGGHVFQIQVTNAQAMYETGFLRQTTGNPLKGDIHIGFNMTRSFGFGKNGNVRKWIEKRKQKKAKSELFFNPMQNEL